VVGAVMCGFQVKPRAPVRDDPRTAPAHHVGPGVQTRQRDEASTDLSDECARGPAEKAYREIEHKCRNARGTRCPIQVRPPASRTRTSNPTWSYVAPPKPLRNAAITWISPEVESISLMTAQWWPRSECDRGTPVPEMIRHGRERCGNSMTLCVNRIFRHRVTSRPRDP
jgi:hypothetical protein